MASIAPTNSVKRQKKRATSGKAAPKVRRRSKKKAFPFLSLPPEVRNMVYEHLLVSKNTIALRLPVTPDPRRQILAYGLTSFLASTMPSSEDDSSGVVSATPSHSPPASPSGVHSNSSPGLPPASPSPEECAEERLKKLRIRNVHTKILRTCKIINTEATPILYGRNHFIHPISTTSSDRPAFYMPKNRLALVRSLDVVMVWHEDWSWRNGISSWDVEATFRRFLDIKVASFLSYCLRRGCAFESFRLLMANCNPYGNAEEIRCNSFTIKALRKLRITSNLEIKLGRGLSLPETFPSLMLASLEKSAAGKDITMGFEEDYMTLKSWSFKMCDRK